MKKLKENFFLISMSCILILGVILRLHAIDSIPHGFFCDEASIAYNAYSLLTTGKDEYGKSFPLFFESFGDFRHPIPVYSAIPFVAFFGMTEESARFPSVMFGIATIIVLYFLGKELYSRQLGIWSAFVGATMPWLIHYNRTGFEFSAYAFFFTTSILLFVKASKNKEYILPAFLFTGVSIYTYQPAKLLLPLLVVGMMCIYFRELKRSKKELLLGIFFFFVFTIPIGIGFVTGDATARFNQVSLFSSDLTLVEIVKRSFTHYVLQLSPFYLFKTGEPTFITRHFTGGLIPLLSITFFFLYGGLLALFFQLKKKHSQTLYLWLFLYPIAGAVVLDGPFTSRAIIGAPLIALLTAFGITIFFEMIPARRLRYSFQVFLILLFFMNVFLFMQFYTSEYRKYSSDFWGWQYGPKDIISYFRSERNNYDYLVMEGAFNAPSIFFQFYAPNDCSKCRVGVPTDFSLKGKILYAVTPSYLQEHRELSFATKKYLYYPNRQVAFQIGEVVE